MARYAIWNKQDTIYTPVGEALAPQEWISRYGWIGNPVAIPVVAAGMINGAYSGELSQMRDLYANMGADFSGCATNEEVLAAIEAFEDQMNTPVVTDESSPEERIAAALEYNNLLNSPVVNTDDPDAE